MLKKKSKGGLINVIVFFCFHIDGPITGRTHERGGGLWYIYSQKFCVLFASVINSSCIYI